MVGVDGEVPADLGRLSGVSAPGHLHSKLDLDLLANDFPERQSLLAGGGHVLGHEAFSLCLR